MPALDEPRAMFGKLVRFGLAGLVATGCYAILLLILAQLTTLPDLVIHTLAFAACIPVSYLLQRRMTFRATVAHAYAVPRFVITTALAFLVTSVAIHYVVTIQHRSVILAIPIAAVIVPAMSFLTMLLWVFVEPRKN